MADNRQYDPQQYFDWGRAACDAALAAGADQAEVWFQNERLINVSVENNRLRTSEEKEDPGFCVRAIRKGATGYARSMGLNLEGLRAAGTRAAALAAAAEPDPLFLSLPVPMHLAHVEDLFDERIHALTARDVIPWATDCVQAARDTHPDVALKADVSVTSGWAAIVNSLGVAASERYSFANVEVFPVVRQGDDVGSYYDFTRARRLSDLKDHAALTEQTTRRAVSFLGGRRVKSGPMPLLLGPVAAFSFLHSVCGAAEAESVLRGRSFLSEKKGVRIAPEILTITERALAPAGLYSGAYDAEGCARADRDVIYAGVLTGYLHNATTAAHAGEALTGNAERAGYLSGVGIGLGNLAVRPGAAPEADLLRGLSSGLYIAMGSLIPNMVSGAVSGTVDFGYIIENGACVAPVSNAMIGGDVFDLLNSIEAVSSDGREEPGNFMPAVLLGAASVAGS